MSGARSILYLAPTFMANRTRKQIRGVQVMDFQILTDLVSLGHRVCVPIEKTWKPRFEEQMGPLARAANLEIVTVPALRKPLFATIACAFALRNHRFEVAILGNVARGIVPGVNMMLRRGVFTRMVIQANAAPKPAFLKSLARWPARVVAVSRHVAESFPAGAGGEPVDVYYGICNPDAFFPPADSQPARPVRFCMLGKLDTALKGVDGVVRAFASLPQGVRERCELHLASFPTMPSAQVRATWGAGVIPHPWMPASDVPAFLRGMDVLIIASASETYSQACVQAMLTGMAVIGRDIPAIREKLDTGAGLCFTDDAGLASCVGRLASDPGLRQQMGREGRSHALTHCVWRTTEFLDRFVFPPGRSEQDRAGFKAG